TPPAQLSVTPPASSSQTACTKRKPSHDSEPGADDPEGVFPIKDPRQFFPLGLSEETLQEDCKAEADNLGVLYYSQESRELFPQPSLIQPSHTSPTSFSPPACTKRKLPREDSEPEAEAEANEPEGLRSSKHRRRLPSPELSEESLQEDFVAEFNRPENLNPSQYSQEPSPLSEEDLNALYKEVMDFAANDARPKSVKRSSSRRSATTGSEGTQRPSSTTAHYRFKILAPAQVIVHADPPNDIQDAFNAIVKAEPPNGRREQLKPMSHTFQAGCTKLVRTSTGENDFVSLLHDLIKSMSSGDLYSLCFRTNADWQEQLKPKTQRSRVNVGKLLSMAGNKQQEVGGASTPPSPKRQQQSPSQPYISPQSSTANPTPGNGQQKSGTMPPPAQPAILENEGAIKTPRPDISVGTEFTALISALSSQHLKPPDAELFLAELQSAKELREPGGPEEPVLISVPAPLALDLVFPFAVIEGKAYSTGKQVFEAENQAAVSGACALKMQLCLDELVNRASPTLSEHPPALFFSICTEGPIHELWAHWTENEYGKRKFKMKLLKCVHGMLLDDLEDFVVAVDNVLRWGTGRFMDSVVARLKKVAEAESLSGVTSGSN
ncbi:MAG: hypothetical protein Q9225_003466, partial [Loekoesia sp. 1 TL-2023]